MKTKSLTLVTIVCFSLMSFNLLSKDVYQSPKLRLDTKKGQTVIIKDEQWESNYRIEDSSKRDVASLKKESSKKIIKRDPSSVIIKRVHPKFD